MFGSRDRSSQRKSTSNRRPRAGKFLRLESLETRHMLSGVVNMTIAGGTLTLTGDVGNNSVVVQADSLVPTNFVVTGQSGTALQLAGNPVASPFVATSITADVVATLGSGTDTFSLQGPSGGGSTTISGNVVINNGNGAVTTILNNVNVAGPGGITINNLGQTTNSLTNVDVLAGNLTISNGLGSATNTFTDVGVNGNLIVVDGAAGDRSLTIASSLVQGTSLVTPTGGSSTIVISNSQFMASAGGIAMTVITSGVVGSQANFTVVDSPGPATTFNAGSFTPPAPFGPPPPPLGPALLINNIGAGAVGKLTQLIGQSPSIPVVVYGNVAVSNALNMTPVHLDIASFTSSNVLGEVSISNSGTAATQTFITNSHLGTQLLQGGPLTLNNGTGADQFSMSGNSSIPFGALINHSALGPPTATFGSNTTITAGALIGNNPFGTAIPGQPGIALAISGDWGVDAVSITGATLGGGVNLGTSLGNTGLLNGNNTVALSGTSINNGGLDVTLTPAATGNNTITLTNSVMAALHVILGGGIDRLAIFGGGVAAELSVQMGLGADTVELRDGTTAPSPPNPLLWFNLIDGEGGVDRFLKDADVDASLWGVTGFELFV